MHKKRRISQLSEHKFKINVYKSLSIKNWNLELFKKR